LLRTMVYKATTTTTFTGRVPCSTSTNTFTDRYP
jgi:hypothetical protein